VYGPGVPAGDAVPVAEKWLAGVLWAHAALSLGFVALAWRDGIAEHADLRFVVNTTGKDGLFAVISVAAALDLRRRLGLVLLLIAAYAWLIVGELFELAFADPPAVMTLPADTEATTFLLLWIGGDIVLLAVLGLLYRAVKSRR
jgi:hypothetical protein